MARLIGSGSDNYGENLFISKALKYLDDETILYHNRQLFGREFDLCVLLPGRGILVIESKGWNENNILRIENSDTIYIRTEEGEVPKSPQKQARGYRFSVERHLHQSIKRFPLVFQMVALPQVTTSFFLKNRLDVVLEQSFTFLQEDLTNKAAFFAKLDCALREVGHWKREPFDKQALWAVRSLFETDLEPESIPQAEAATIEPYRSCNYSLFYYIAKPQDMTSELLDEIILQYTQGCKVYGVLADKRMLQLTAKAVDEALARKGLIRSGGNLELALGESRTHAPALSAEADSFSAFHCVLCIAALPEGKNIPSFCVRNGIVEAEQKRLLRELASYSIFNAEQYLVEHASPEKNIVIRAGAGTGKTHTMISRIGFICHTQRVPLLTMADRIVMITFTNDTADQMSQKLKEYFRNCYLMTAQGEYLDMAARVDRMQISTIHAYAKRLIAQLGPAFGFGLELGVTSSEYYRRRKVAELLDDYIQKKKRECGRDYTNRLGLPVYVISSCILDFINKLHNKSIDVTAIQASDFGPLAPEDIHHELHELLATVIPAVEQAYYTELQKSNRIHLGSMMSMLNKFVKAPVNEDRLRALKKDKGAAQFMLVDEFQDTDDAQIESLLTLARLLDYRLFLVGDIKQCIYRFRGAKEKAFDQLKISENKTCWLEFALQRNYRTDAALLNLFDRCFSSWGRRSDELLAYEPNQDRLIGTRDYNGPYKGHPERFFRQLTVASEKGRISTLIGEIRRLQDVIRREEAQGLCLTAKEKSIAILVRENWQADIIRTECAHVGINVQTKTGGDLYMSQPALDMMALVNALLHFDEADYLYALAVSNFFRLDIPRSNLYGIRERIRAGQWRAKIDEREQVNYLIRYMNLMLSNTSDRDNTWEYIITSLRTKPVLQVLRKLYGTLAPWAHYSEDPAKQHSYQLNVDLLFEQLIDACNVDRLTVNTLQEHLFNCIISKVSVDSRTPTTDTAEFPIQCITVHKAKGLEYGHVILPFCSTPIEKMKKAQLHVSTAKEHGRVCIGYSLNVGELSKANAYYDGKIEQSEKSREETRILYVAMTRAIRSFSWIELEGKQALSWQSLIETED